jgi:hypothetical protein
MDKFNRVRIVAGIIFITVGGCVLWAGHTYWALRGFAEMLFGGYIVFSALGKINAT